MIKFLLCDKSEHFAIMKGWRKMVNPFKGDKEKLAKMTFGKKIDYIWTYYRFWIITAIIVIALVAAFIQAQLAYNPNAMTILLCDTYCEDTETAYTEMNTEFSQFIGLDADAKEPINVDDTFFFTTQSSSSGNAAMAQKFLALVISGEADLMFAPKEAIDYYGSQNMFADLSEVLPEDLFNYLESAGLLFEVTYTPTEDEMEDGAVEETYYGGIRLGDVDYFSEKGITMEDACVSVFYNGDHQSLAIDFLNMIFGFESDTAPRSQDET